MLAQRSAAGPSSCCCSGLSASQAVPSACATPRPPASISRPIAIEIRRNASRHDIVHILKLNLVNLILLRASIPLLELLLCVHELDPILFRAVPAPEILEEVH